MTTKNRSTARKATPAPPAVSPSDRKAALRARSGIERAPPKPPAQSSYPIGKGRKTQKGISIYMHPLAKATLDTIAEEQGMKIQELGLEALNLLFRHYGKKPIA